MGQKNRNEIFTESPRKMVPRIMENEWDKSDKSCRLRFKPVSAELFVENAFFTGD